MKKNKALIVLLVICLFTAISIFGLFFLLGSVMVIISGSSSGNSSNIDYETYSSSIIIEEPYVITSFPGWRRNPTTDEEVYHYHCGTDIVSQAEIPIIYSYDDGIVVKAISVQYGYGMHILIEHENNSGNKYWTKYAHLSDMAVSKGEVVDKGQAIGIMGNTGLSTGPHLHFELNPIAPSGYSDNNCLSWDGRKIED